MKRLLISTFALVLLAAVPAAGAPNDRHHHRGHPQAQSEGATRVHANRAVIRSQAVRVERRRAVGAHVIRTDFSVRHRERARYQNTNWTERRHRSILRNISDRHDNDRRDNNRRRGNYGRSDRSSNPVMELRHNRPQNWNVRPRHFDARTYRRNFEAPRRFHWNAYNRPRGWYAHRWTYGERLPRTFWVRDYWVNDWWSFDLPQPPYGYEWVRYGDDALLVNIDTGEVLQVEYDLFD